MLNHDHMASEGSWRTPQGKNFKKGDRVFRVVRRRTAMFRRDRKKRLRRLRAYVR